MVNEKHQRTREERIDQVGMIIKRLNEFGVNWKVFPELLPVHDELKRYIDTGLSFTGTFPILTLIGGRKKSVYIALNNHRLKECISVIKNNS